MLMGEGSQMSITHPITPPDIFEELARALYGREWAQGVARDYRRPVATVEQWAVDGAPREIVELIRMEAERKVAAINQALHRVPDYRHLSAHFPKH